MTVIEPQIYETLFGGVLISAATDFEHFVTAAFLHFTTDKLLTLN